MAAQSFIKLQIRFESEKIIFVEEELSPSPVSINSKDEVENNGAINIRIEFKVAKVFHKVLNLLKEDSNLFQKEDYELLGEMLHKILFGKDDGDPRNNTMKRMIRDKKPCLLFIDLYNNNDMAVLPWEYTLFKFRDSKTQKQIPFYLSSDLDYKFHMIRRFKTNKYERENPNVLNVIILEAAGGNEAAGIDSRLPQYRFVTDVFKKLEAAYPQKLFYEEVIHADFKNLRKNITEKIESLKKRSGSDKYVIHYFGHSGFHDQTGKLVLYDGKDPAWVEDKKFADVFDYRKLTLPDMVAFQACDSAKIGCHANELRGVAFSLVEKDIPAIVGMQNDVNVAVSSTFFYKFYESLLKGENVAVAMTTGRDYLGKGDAEQEELYRDNSFGTPVLMITTDEPISFLDDARVEPLDEIALKIKVCKSCLTINSISDKRCRNKNCNRELDDTNSSPGPNLTQTAVVENDGAHSKIFSAAETQRNDFSSSIGIPDIQKASLNNDQSSRE